MSKEERVFEIPQDVMLRMSPPIDSNILAHILRQRNGMPEIIHDNGIYQTHPDYSMERWVDQESETLCVRFTRRQQDAS